MALLDVERTIRAVIPTQVAEVNFLERDFLLVGDVAVCTSANRCFKNFRAAGSVCVFALSRICAGYR